MPSIATVPLAGATAIGVGQPAEAARRTGMLISL